MFKGRRYKKGRPRMFYADAKAFADPVPVRAEGLTSADADGDGVNEVLVAVKGGGNLVLKWNGEALVDIADPVLADPAGGGRGFIAADLDGDGREELYLLNGPDGRTGAAASRDRLFASFGRRWMDLLDLPENDSGGGAPLSDGGAVAVDRHGRGRYGFFLVGVGGPARLYELGPRGYLVDAAEDAGLDVVAEARSATVLPVASSRMDVFVAAVDGPNRLFRNIGDGGYEEIGAEKAVADLHAGAHAAAVFDADGDGMLDLLTATPKGPQRLYLQRPGMAFVEVAGPELAEIDKVVSVVAADFDNDGFDEVFFHVDGGRNRLFAWRDDEWREVDIGAAAEPKAAAAGALAADVDSDGRLELILSHGEGAAAPLSLYRPEPNHNNWLRVAPLTAHGAPARGAVVGCKVDGRWSRRILCAGSGRLCQMEPAAHFGLGAAEEVEQIEICWPDGVVVVIDNPPINRTLNAPYPPE
jgi:hypothetical protein